MRIPRLLWSCIAAAGLGLASPAGATWSICISDSETKEVAVGSVTCLANFDLLAKLPVVVVGKGAGASQAAVDATGQRRLVIFSGLNMGLTLSEILDVLSGLQGHENRQYGIADTTGDALTFTGSQTLRWAGGVTGTQGTMSYAIQGNILAGGCVVPAIEAAVLGTAGDIPAKLMAGMEAARDMGGDGRCSCSPAEPESCGCPPAAFDKSGHIGTMVVARVGDTDDDNCDLDGCADGDYFMKFNVAFQTADDPEPVDQLRDLFDAWRAGLVGVTDAIQSQVSFDADVIPPNGVSSVQMTIALLDWQGLPITEPIGAVTVEHATDSAGLSTIGAVTDVGNGVWKAPVTSGTEIGVDRFVVTAMQAAEGTGSIILAPNPSFEYFEPGDLDGDGTVGILDFLGLLALWGPCPNPCAGDLDGDGIVGILDFLDLLGNWS